MGGNKLIGSNGLILFFKSNATNDYNFRELSVRDTTSINQHLLRFFESRHTVPQSRFLYLILKINKNRVAKTTSWKNSSKYWPLQVLSLLLVSILRDLVRILVLIMFWMCIIIVSLFCYVLMMQSYGV